MINYYSILGISENATNEQIEAAYKKRIIKYHPDKNQGSEVSEHMTIILNQAKETLLDAKKRLEHDYAMGIKQKPEPTAKVEYVPHPNENAIRQQGINEGVGKALVGVALTGLVIALLNEID